MASRPHSPLLSSGARAAGGSRSVRAEDATTRGGDSLGDSNFRLGPERHPSLSGPLRLRAADHPPLLQLTPPPVWLSTAPPTPGLGLVRYFLCLLPFQSLPFSRGLPLSVPMCFSMTKTSTATQSRSSVLDTLHTSVPSLLPFAIEYCEDRLHLGSPPASRPLIP